MIFIICSTTFINNYIEIFERKNSKPEFNKVMAEISNNPQNKIEILSNSKDGHKWVTNYLNKGGIGVPKLGNRIPNPPKFIFRSINNR